MFILKLLYNFNSFTSYNGFHFAVFTLLCCQQKLSPIFYKILFISLCQFFLRLCKLCNLGFRYCCFLCTPLDVISIWKTLSFVPWKTYCHLKIDQKKSYLCFLVTWLFLKFIQARVGYSLGYSAVKFFPQISYKLREISSPVTDISQTSVIAVLS